jgi:hypothetical protein
MFARKNELMHKRAKYLRRRWRGSTKDCGTCGRGTGLQMWSGLLEMALRSSDRTSSGCNVYLNPTPVGVKRAPRSRNESIPCQWYPQNRCFGLPGALNDRAFSLVTESTCNVTLVKSERFLSSNDTLTSRSRLWWPVRDILAPSP